MQVIKVFSNQEGKQSLIGLAPDGSFCVQFFNPGYLVGEINYPNKSFPYVEDAAENWTLGITTEETIKKYKTTV